MIFLYWLLFKVDLYLFLGLYEFITVVKVCCNILREKQASQPQVSPVLLCSIVEWSALLLQWKKEGVMDQVPGCIWHGHDHGCAKCVPTLGCYRNLKVAGTLPWFFFLTPNSFHGTVLSYCSLRQMPSASCLAGREILPAIPHSPEACSGCQLLLDYVFRC